MPLHPLKIHPVTNANEIIAITEAAAADNHYVAPPTDYWTNEKGEIRGYFSSGIIPVCHFWMHSDSSPRQSRDMIKRCERIFYDRGNRLGMLACDEKSPFFPTLEKHFGYKRLFKTTIFFKDLTNAYKI